MLTFCISTYNNLNYLKLVVESVRNYSYYVDARFIIHAENCTDGTDEWLRDNSLHYNLEYYIDKNDVPIGIGGGMNFCADLVESKYICFLHSDMVVSKFWDKSLVEYAEQHSRTWVDSFRIEPDIFGTPPARKATIQTHKNMFGEFYSNFNNDLFQNYAIEFTKLNCNVIYPVVQGVSGLIEKSCWDEIGGNDAIFAPASYEDLDLFLRMQKIGIDYVSIGSSLLYHFGARGSHFPDDNFSISSNRQEISESKNRMLWIRKWNYLPRFNEYGMIIGLKYN
tara:strand:+ start:3233 stop:4072 length:840 start_codon:yes stop_codon:yes gene_type:complete